MYKKLMKTACLTTALALASLSALAAPMPDSFADLVARLKPSVVNISSVKVIKGHGSANPFGDERLREFFGDDFFKRNFGGGGDEEDREIRTPSLGSGFIWDRDGYVITNNHVIKDSTEVKVILEGGKEFDAKVVGADQDTDVAVLKIDPGSAELKPVKRGNSDSIRVGDWVLAIGNPFGYGHTVTAGIISAKERVIGSGPYDDFLQTDAAINPGNSGGPLFDLNGGVVGINSAKIEGASSIGFAIPINLAASIIDQLREGDGKVTRAWLGVSIQPLTGDIAKSLGLDKPSGALVGQVFKDGPAAKAGLERGDVILKFDGKEVERSAQLPLIVASHKPDSSVEMEVFRKGEVRKFQVKLGTRDQERMAEATTGDAKKLGLSVQEITPDLKKHFDIEADKGVIVTAVDPKSPAATAGLRRGDIIVEVNRREVNDLDSFNDALSGADKKESVLLAVERRGVTTYLVVRTPEKKAK